MKKIWCKRLTVAVPGIASVRKRSNCISFFTADQKCHKRKPVSRLIPFYQLVNYRSSSCGIKLSVITYRKSFLYKCFIPMERTSKPTWNDPDRTLIDSVPYHRSGKTNPICNHNISYGLFVVISNHTLYNDFFLPADQQLVVLLKTRG